MFPAPPPSAAILEASNLMEGSLHQRGKDRTWYLRYDEPSEPGERRKQRNIRVGKMPKSDAEARKRAILRELDEGKPQEVSTPVTVEEFLNGWLTTIQSRVAATTYARYADVVKRHVVPVIGKVRLKKVAPEHLRRVYTSVRERGLSNQTCLHVHRILHTAFKYAVCEERILTQNVVALVKAPKPDAREVPAMSRDSVKLLIEAARGTRLETPVALAAVSGLRRGEVLALRWRNVDLGKAALYVSESLEQTREHGVRFKGPKSKSSRRFVPLSPESVEQLLSSSSGAKRDEEQSGGSLRRP